MDNTILIAIISGLCVAIPSVIATITSHNKAQALTEYQITELTKKVEKHNQVIERMALAERDIANLKQDMIDVKKARA